MAIHFLVRVNRKKAPRINVLRYLKEGEGDSKQSHKSLGTLPEDLTTATEVFKDLLDEFELYQLENYVKNALFNRAHFNTQVDQTERELVYFAPEFHEALFTLWKLAKENQLDFNPHEVMLTAIFNKAKAVERSLNEKRGCATNVLEAIGVDIQRFDKKEINKRLHTGSQQLFQALIESGEALEMLCEKFNNLAGSYKKHVNLKPRYLKDYANLPKRFPLWYCAIAIEILLELNHDPLKIISIEQALNAWLTLKKDNFSTEELTELFINRFNPELKKEEIRTLIEDRCKINA